MKLTFWGASRQVTGSMFLLEFEDDLKILVDCGLDLDKRRKSETGKAKNPYNAIFPFEASEISAVLLTHAHLDHSGMIPNLFREGFEGKIYCTMPTFHLVQILLEDMAQINERRLKAMDRGKKGAKALDESVNRAELFTEKHVINALKHFHTVEFDWDVKLGSGVSARFNITGHLLGAANIKVTYQHKGGKVSVGFSGDVGRAHYPLILDPVKFDEVDYLVCESTYGNRMHQDTATREDLVEEVVFRACVEKAGKLIIPAFSVGRTQAMLFTLHKLFTQNRLPQVPVYTDSPMAILSTRIHEKLMKYLNPEAQNFFKQHGSLFDFEQLHYIQDIRASKQLDNDGEPMILLSASGMISGGRIENHIKRSITNPKVTVFMIGYSAEGTVGNQLLTKQKSITMGKKTLEVRADIVTTDVFSGHADAGDLLKFVSYQNPNKLKKLFLVHGEHQSMEELSVLLAEKGFKNIEMPIKGSTYDLLNNGND